jgi:O-antigen ligase
MKRSPQIFLTILVFSFVSGIGLALVTRQFGYSKTGWLLCGIPAGFMFLWILQSARTQLKALYSQLCWWHFLWLLVFLSGLVFRVRNVAATEANVVDFWALYRIILMGIVAIALLHRLIFQRNSWDRSFFRGLIGLVSAYAMVSLASTLWSVYPMWTAYKSIEYLVDIALIAAIIVSVRSVQDFKTLFDWTWTLIGFVVAIVWLEVALWPARAIIHSSKSFFGFQIQGVLPAIDNNSVGEYGAILGIVALTRLLFPTSNRRFYLVVFLIGMVTLVSTQSRSPLIGFLVASLLVLFAARRIGVVGLLIFLTPAILSLTDLGDLLWQFFQRGQTAREFESVSGRAQLWEVSWKLFKEQPLFGYGAYAAGRFAVIGKLTDIGWTSLASTWLEVILGTGALGLLPFLGAFLGIWIVLLRSVPGATNYSVWQPLQVEAIGLMALMSVRSGFTPEFIWHPPLNFFLVLGCAELLRQAYRKQVYEATYRTASVTPA